MDRVNAIAFVQKCNHLKEYRMKIIRFLLPALLLALVAIPAQAQSKANLDKGRGAADNIRQADPPRAQPAPPVTTTDSASEARRQRDAEQRAHAERFPPKPLRALPPAPSTSSSVSDKGK
jgi:hypothetical protein